MNIAALPLATRRLLLRRFVADDLACFQSYRRDPAVGRYQGWTATDDTAAAAFIAAMSTASIGVPGEWVQIAVADKRTGELVGDIGLCIRAAPAGSAEIGFTMAPAAQGKGFGTEAVGRFIAMLFERTDVASIEGITDARNAPSIRLLERVGMRLCYTREAQFRGKACTELIYSLDRTAWSRPLE